MFARTLPLVCLGLLSLEAPSQDSPSQEPVGILSQATGLIREGEAWRGMGGYYEVLFGEDDIDFMPPLGRHTERLYTMRFRLDSVRRAEDPEPEALPRPEREVDFPFVRYRRPEFVECYEIRPEGLEQSYVFDSLPPGSGDLVVGGDLVTEFVPDHYEWTNEGILLKLAGGGEIRIGEVTGIDAEGRRVRGSLRCAEGRFELSLPGEFVDRAQLPLVLDPLISPRIPIPDTSDPEKDPDVAYDVTYDKYLVVFEREVSGVSNIRGYFLDGAGQVIPGALIGVSSTLDNSSRPKIANINSQDGFVCVWAENVGSGDTNIMAAGVSADTGVSTPAASPVTSAAGVQFDPDVTGESNLTDYHVIAVWKDETAGTIEARRLSYNTSGASPSFLLLGTASFNIDGTWPKISRIGGDSGRYLLTWWISRNGNPTEIRGMVIDRDLNILTNSTRISPTGPTHRYFHSVDGDGSEWTVTYGVVEGANNHVDVACRRVRFDPSTNRLVRVGSEIPLASEPMEDEFFPAIGFFGDSYLVSYYDEGDVMAASIDPWSCADCEGRFTVDGRSAWTPTFSEVTSHWHSGGSEEKGMVVWEAVNGAREDVFARLYEAEDGNVESLGGGCGNGGEAYGACGIEGNANFEHRLEGAPANTTAYLILSTRRLDLACGGCTLIADPFSGFALTAQTNAQGIATVPMAIPTSPALQGLFFFDQWLVPGGGCAPLGVEMSDAIRVTLE